MLNELVPVNRFSGGDAEIDIPRPPARIGRVTDQPPFSLSETRRSFPMALLRARESVMTRFRALLSEHDVTEQQWRVLRVVKEMGMADAGSLAQRTSLLAPSLSRILKVLEGRGVIRTGKDAQDGRRTLVTLTESGDAMLRRIAPESAEIYREIESLIGAERLARMLDDLEHVQRVMETPPPGTAPNRSSG